MIYIDKQNDLLDEYFSLKIPKEITKHYTPLYLTLFNGQSLEVFISGDLYDSSESEYYLLLTFLSENIRQLNIGYYTYVVRDKENNLIACGLLNIESENITNTVYDHTQTNIVYQG